MPDIICQELSPCYPLIYCDRLWSLLLFYRPGLWWWLMCMEIINAQYIMWGRVCVRREGDSAALHWEYGKREVDVLYKISCQHFTFWSGDWNLFTGWDECALYWLKWQPKLLKGTTYTIYTKMAANSKSLPLKRRSILYISQSYSNFMIV